MRFVLASSILLCFLAAQFPVNNAGVVPAKLECRNFDCTKTDSIGWSVVNDLFRRAGGGGGGGRGDGRGDGHGSNNGGGGSGGSGNGSPQTEGGQTGETGGFTGQETEGGFSGDVNTGHPVNDPANAPANPPADNPANAPSIRNNFGNPAQSQEQKYNPSPLIDVAAKAAEFRTRIQTAGIQNGPWFFYSGFADKNIRDETHDALGNRLKATRVVGMDENGRPITKPMPALGDAMAAENADPDRLRLVGTPNAPYFWAAVSRAYSQAVSGKVYIVAPVGRPINIPKDNGDGSVWWSFEAPDLSRNPDVDSITYVSVDLEPTMSDNPNDPIYELGPDKVIWSRGDPPLGTPGDERHMETAPAQAWYG
jgi:hypothetical protein